MTPETKASSPLAPEDFEQIRYAMKEEILTITLARPERLNAFTPRMADELVAAFALADADDDVRVVIVTGEGRGFCAAPTCRAAGTRLTGASGRLGDTPRDGGGRVALAIFACTKPVIAAINGPAVGVGVTMTLPMDIRLAARRREWASCSPGAGSCPRPARAGFCRGWWASARRWSGWRRAGLRRARGAGRAARAEHPPGRGAVRRRPRAGARDRREHGPGLGCAGAADAWTMLCAEHPMLAHRWRRFARDVLSRAVGRRQGGRDVVSGEARGRASRTRSATACPHISRA